jgi:hypothetical protein
MPNENFHRKTRIIYKTTYCNVAAVKISLFSNSSHLEWRAGLSDTILKGTHPRTIPARFGVIWFSGFRGKDLNVIFYQNMSNLHNQYESAERKISQNKMNCELMLTYDTPALLETGSRNLTGPKTLPTIWATYI